MASAASRRCALILLVSLVFFSSSLGVANGDEDGDKTIRGNQLVDRPCDEVYVVGEGETLHMISDKCGDPFIVEQNPHINDPDDVFPGLVIQITPFNSRKLLR